MATTANFQVIYDVTEAWWPDWYLLLIGIGIISLGALTRWSEDDDSRNLPAIFFGCAWSAIVIFFSLVPFLEFRYEMGKGQCKIYEGIVENFDGEPWGGHDAAGENFDVAGTHFSYNNYVLSPGYRDVVSHGAPPIAGRYVRICAIGKDIGRLEIRN